MYHVLLDLNDVSLDTSILKVLLQILQLLLQGGSVHVCELVWRDVDLLLLLALLAFLLPHLNFYLYFQ